MYFPSSNYGSNNIFQALRQVPKIYIFKDSIEELSFNLNLQCNDMLESKYQEKNPIQAYKCSSDECSQC